MIISAIDIGTNSIRCMSASVTKDGAAVIHQDGQITRIGKNVGTSGKISPKAAASTLKALKSFHAKCKKLGSKKIVIAATSALRDADNSDIFIKKAQKITGLPISIITGDEEARLASLGVSNSLKVVSGTLILDIGGGSSELALNENRTVETLSLDIGAVRLTEKFLSKKEPGESDYKKIENFIGNFLEKNITPRFVKARISCMIGAGGTVTSLAAIKLMLEKYSHEKVHGLTLSIKDVENVLNIIKFIPLSERKNIVGLDPARSDIILAGLYILKNIMGFFEIDRIKVSDRGILYGLIVNEIEQRIARF